MNFLLVLGVQKGGTTWMHQQLDQHPQYESAYIKEWRCIDKATNATINGADVDKDIVFIKEEDWKRKKELQKRRFANRSLHNYFSIQLSASKWDPLNTRCVGDATPSNGIKSEETLTFFKQSAEKAGFLLKPILIMRDPTARHLSASVMNFSMQRLKDIKGSGITNFDPELHSEELELLAISRLEKWKFRGQYEKQIPLFEKIFGEDNIKYIFSENLRKDRAIDIVTDYLNLDRFQTPGLPEYPKGKGANATIKYEFKNETKNSIRTAFSETYSFISERFGDDMPDAWLD